MKSRNGWRGILLEPMFRAVDHLGGRTLQVERAFDDARVKRAVVSLESLRQTVHGARAKISANEGCRVVPVRSEHGGQRHGARRQRLAVLPDAVGKRIGGGKERNVRGQGDGRLALISVKTVPPRASESMCGVARCE